MSSDLALAAYETGLADLPMSGTVTWRTPTTVVSNRGTRDNGPDAVAKPTDLADGDEMYIVVGLSYQGGQDTITGPSGWTEIGQYGAGDSVRLSVWYHHCTTAASEPSSYAFSWQTGIASAVIHCIAAAGLVPPADAKAFSGTTAGRTSHATPGGTTSVDTYVLSCYAMPTNQGQSGTLTDPAGTTRIVYGERAAGSSIALLVVGERAATPGALASRTLTTSNSIADAMATIAVPVLGVTTSTQSAAPTAGLSQGPTRSARPSADVMQPATRSTTATTRLSTSDTRSLSAMAGLFAASVRSAVPAAGIRQSHTRSMATSANVAALETQSVALSAGVGANGLMNSAAPSASLTTGGARSSAPSAALAASERRGLAISAGLAQTDRTRGTAPTATIARLDRTQSAALAASVVFSGTRGGAVSAHLTLLGCRSTAITTRLDAAMRRSSAPSAGIAQSGRIRSLVPRAAVLASAPLYRGSAEIIATVSDLVEIR